MIKRFIILILLTLPVSGYTEILMTVVCHDPTGHRVDYLPSLNHEELSKWAPDIVEDGYKDTHPNFIFYEEDGNIKASYSWGNTSGVDELADKLDVDLKNKGLKNLTVITWLESRISGLMFAPMANAMFTFFPKIQKAVFTWHSLDITSGLKSSTYLSDCEFSLK